MTCTRAVRAIPPEQNSCTKRASEEVEEETDGLPYEEEKPDAPV